MTNRELEQHPKLRELKQVLLDLSLVSHVQGTTYDSSGGGASPKDKAGSRPPGEPDWKGDHEPDYRQKSHLYFMRRLRNLSRGLDKLSDERVVEILDQIVKDASEALKAWRKSPQPEGIDPPRGTKAWKIQIANDPRSSRVVAGHYGVTHTTVLRYIDQYLGVEL